VPKPVCTSTNPPTAMDRREALKKLAIGGAIAAGGSIVLSSNAVAQSASGPAVAPQPSAVPISVPVSGSGTGTVTVSAPPAPAGAVLSATTYEWQIHTCRVSNGRTLVIINPANNQIIARGQKGTCSAIPVKTGPLPNVPTVLIRTVAGGSTTPKELERGDTVSLKFIVKWSVGGQTVEGRYNVGGTYPNIKVTQG
jgi:hypothetical protein